MREFLLRELGPSDFDAAARLFRETCPHRSGEVRFWQQTESQERPRRWVAVTDQNPGLVGYASLWNVRRQKYRLDVIVDRDWRRCGIGSRLFSIVLEEAKRVGAHTVQARAQSDWSEALTFLEHRGFVETMRMHGFVLELSRLDDRALSIWARAITDEQIVTAPVSMSQIDDGQFWRRLGELQRAATEGWPDPDPGGPIDPISESGLRKMLLPSDNMPLAFFTAETRGQLLAYSVLAMRQQPDGEAQFVTTAVRPEFRNQRIATALRARCLAVAKAAGCRTIRSASGHPAILRLNARLGFQRTDCEVRLVRQATQPVELDAPD
jgi:GNAT superfamily N-acetyltransferase